MLAVLAAILDSRHGATLNQVAERTGLDRKTVSDLIGKAIEQAGVQIEKSGATYRITDLGPLLKKSGVMSTLSLQGALNAL